MLGYATSIHAISTTKGDHARGDRVTIPQMLTRGTSNAIPIRYRTVLTSLMIYYEVFCAYFGRLLVTLVPDCAYHCAGMG